MPPGRDAAPRTYDVVVGVAGHIDHGKTSLVRALTGIETDRLAEEKRRGISIDLGFAHLSLPNGTRIALVDVPGHERFIKNMLAGVGGVRAALLVVAADEGVKPQTREHFAICRLLGVEHGLIALTKTDIASADQIAAATEHVRTLCVGSFLANAPIVPVSAASRAGLPALTQELAGVIANVAARDASGLARLPVDRSFALKGFGTVVTGTLWSGTLRTGDTVQLHPSGKDARIRGLQVHGGRVDVAVAGQRTAVNLTGIDHGEIHRGDVLTHKTGLQTSKRLDVLLDWLEGAEIPATRRAFHLYIGAAEVHAVLKPLSGGALARLELSAPVLAFPGDRFVLRRPSPGETVAGGCVLDAFPPLRLSRAKITARLERLRAAGVRERIEMLVGESSAGRRVDELVRLTGETAAHLQRAIASSGSLVVAEGGQRVVAQTWIAHKRVELLQWLAAFHKKHPSLAGAPMAQARMGADADIAPLIFAGLPEVRIEGDTVSLRSHAPAFNTQETQALARIELAFRQAGFQPPTPAEVLRAAGLESSKARGLLETLIKKERLVRIAENLIFHRDVIAHVRTSLAAHKGRRFSVPEFKEWTQISRKYAIPLLEYLDHQRVTRRDGDARIIL